MEIKFRAWNKEEKHMFRPSWISFEQRTVGVPEDEEWCYYNFGELEFMQSTGLKDKNGKEIFEGDILKWENGEVYLVVYWDGAFRFNAGTLEGECLGDFALDQYAEITGNCYEDADLV